MIKRKMVHLAALGAAVLVGLGAVADAQTNIGDVIAKRQESMKANGAAMKTLTPIVRGDAPWDQAAATKAAMALADTGKALPQAFPQGSGPDAGKTAALPVIWQQWSDFQAKSKALADEGSKLTTLAQANDQAGFKVQFANVGKACGGCHETYRQKQN